MPGSTRRFRAGGVGAPPSPAKSHFAARSWRIERSSWANVVAFSSHGSSLATGGTTRMPNGISFIPTGTSLVPLGISLVTMVTSFIPSGLSFMTNGTSFMALGISLMPAVMGLAPHGLSLRASALGFVPCVLSLMTVRMQRDPTRAPARPVRPRALPRRVKLDPAVEPRHDHRARAVGVRHAAIRRVDRASSRASSSVSSRS